jgi:hypothetical protein
MYASTAVLNAALSVWQKRFEEGLAVGESVGFDEGLAVGESVDEDGLAVEQVVTAHQFSPPLVDTGAALFVQPER